MSTLKSINVDGKLITFDEPKVMGVINLTPDSFYSGSRSLEIDEIVGKAQQMIEEGATFLDVGGYSSRPGAEDISIEDEIKRIKEPITQILNALPEAIVSVDTFRSKVAEMA
ncbi:MAG: dihydropteroate synthase, partial [Thiotrichales bacterium]|nr:dihydropteroate synthase [Thiotrichales bacterium]